MSAFLGMHADMANSGQHGAMITRSFLEKVNEQMERIIAEAGVPEHVAGIVRLSRDGVFESIIAKAPVLRPLMPEKPKPN